MAIKKPLVLYGGLYKELASTDTIGYTDVVGYEAAYGTTNTITLPYTPASGTIKPFKNGGRLPSFKFSLLGAVVTLTDGRTIDDLFSFDFKY